jgi:hypothetical protein
LRKGAMGSESGSGATMTTSAARLRWVPSRKWLKFRVV